MTEPTRFDLQRVRTWLDGEVRVSRKLLVVVGGLILVLAGVALD